MNLPLGLFALLKLFAIDLARAKSGKSQFCETLHNPALDDLVNWAIEDLLAAYEKDTGRTDESNN